MGNAGILVMFNGEKMEFQVGRCLITVVALTTITVIAN